MSLCTAATHKIVTITDRPIFNRNSRLPVNYEEVINKEIEKLKSLGIIRPSKSPWCSRIVPVPKSDGTLRMCIDYRPLNQVTVKDAYPIPMISEILDTVSKSRVFSTLDATSGYYQIAVDLKDIEKTAFGWKGGLYEFTRMPFGLCNAPATFQRAMDTVLRNELWKFAIAYLDDIIIFSETEEQHFEHLKIVMGKLKAAGIALNQKKCKFFKKEIKILGNIITEGKVLPDPEKIEALKNYEVPNTIKELRSFMGLANYVREFIPKFSEIAAPMSDILKGEEKRSVKQIKWTKEEFESFYKIKKAIIEITYRAQPNFDNEFILTTDASSIAIGAVLTQVGKDCKEEMISAFSRKLDSTQENYSVTDKELLAVVKSVEHYKHYLLGKEFVLRTDHKAIEYLWSTQNDSSRLLRWALKLQEYKFRLEYVKGENNIADGLSRPIEKKINHIEMNPEYNESQKAKILHEYHTKLGHGSPENMKFSINQKYKWKSMFKDIENYVKKCDICLRGGEARVNTKNRIIMSARPNELWVCDLIGRIPCKNGRNKFIFVAIDHYSKWIETKVLATKDAESTKEAIEELIIKKHGIPEKIMSDNGLEFTNSAIKELAKKNHIEWIFNSPEHHQTVGVVERANQSLMNKLKKLTDYGRLSWELKLKEATEAVNYSFQRCLRTSPYIFKYAKAPIFEIDKELGIPEIIIPKTDSKNNRDIYFDSYAKKNIEKGKVEIKRKFNINDPVLIFKQPLSDKFKENWKQGYKVLKHIEPDAYIVSDGKSEYRLNKSHIKLDTSKAGERDVAKGVYKRVIIEPHAITKE